MRLHDRAGERQIHAPAGGRPAQRREALAGSAHRLTNLVRDCRATDARGQIRARGLKCWLGSWQTYGSCGRNRELMLKHLLMMTLLLAASSVSGTQNSVTVPSSLVLAASRPLGEFAFALADASVPAGLEIREVDDGAAPPSSSNIDKNQRVPLEEVMTAFNARQHDYHAVVRRGVVVIRPVSGNVSFLERQSPITQEIKITGLMAAARRVFVDLDSGLSGPILNSIGHKGDDIPVTLDGRGGRTVMDTLNQIVAQAPGRVWVVTTREGRDGVRVVSFGLIQAGGSRRTQPMRLDRS